jgi:hypothetical protein
VGRSQDEEVYSACSAMHICRLADHDRVVERRGLHRRDFTSRASDSHTELGDTLRALCMDGVHATFRDQQRIRALLDNSIDDHDTNNDDVKLSAIHKCMCMREGVPSERLLNILEKKRQQRKYSTMNSVPFKPR